MDLDLNGVRSCSDPLSVPSYRRRFRGPANNLQGESQLLILPPLS